MRGHLLRNIAGAIWTRERARITALRAATADELVTAAVVFQTATQLLDADIQKLARTFVRLGGKP